MYHNNSDEVIIFLTDKNIERVSRQFFIDNYKNIFDKLPEEFQNETLAYFYIEFDEFRNLASVKVQMSGDALYYDVVNYDSEFNIDSNSCECWYRLTLHNL